MDKKYSLTFDINNLMPLSIQERMLVKIHAEFPDIKFVKPDEGGYWHTVEAYDAGDAITHLDALRAFKRSYKMFDKVAIW